MDLIRPPYGGTFWHPHTRLSFLRTRDLIRLFDSFIVLVALQYLYVAVSLNFTYSTLGKCTLDELQ